MNTYISDKEQIEMIKNWWRENGKFTIITIIVTLILSYGWRHYQEVKGQRTAEASLRYEHLLSKETQGREGEINNDIQTLMTQFKNTPYSSMAAFIAAQHAVQQNHFDEAKQNYEWILHNSKSADFKQIARLREARLLLAEKKYAEALDLIKTTKLITYLPLVNELRGDIYSAQNKKQDAKAAYQNALSGLPADAPNHNLVEMKLDQVNN